MPPDTDHVKVAVRVRPFNARERQRNARCIVEMEGTTTRLFNPNANKEIPKQFTYDFSYWSHDGFKEKDSIAVVDPNHENGHKYADQVQVYEQTGRIILNNAWHGYNAALFAYGQTGSGKSYSVVGFSKNKGIVPRLCEELFDTISRNKENNVKTVYEVKFSMMEIYNEMVRDLCSGDQTKNKKGLRVREHPTKGFYAEGLKSYLVTSHKEIAQKIEEGTTNRSIASTNMNETSSRAHTIVCISVIQKTIGRNNEETTKSSSINLVDLAGSERLSGTQAVGDRLKEGVSINQSLSCLGNCIHALAERSSGKSVRVPFRDSVLTRLLMNALGGNSKTVMIATISPADINYDETHSTLRYADRAKQIKTHATVNEDATNRLIKQLREENEKLKRMMEQGISNIPNNPQVVDQDVNDLRKKWEDEMKAAMAENDRRMQEMRQTYEEKLKEKHRQEQEAEQSEQMNRAYNNQALEVEDAKKSNPYLSNLNFDEQLSGKIIHIVQEDVNLLGKLSNCNVILYGPSILDVHAKLYRKGAVVILEQASEHARILLNGDSVSTKVFLNHNDRLLFGTTQLYVFINPIQEKRPSMSFSEVTFELAQEEIATKAGFEFNQSDNQSIETALLNKDLLEILPNIELANAISEELSKNVRFEIMLVSPHIMGKMSRLSSSSDHHTTNDQTHLERTHVYIRVYNINNNLEFEWAKEKFLNRLYIMKEMYQNFEQSNDDWDLPLDKDPFYDEPNLDQLIGVAHLFLQPLAFMVELNEQIEIIDYRGNEVGIINIDIHPCDENRRLFNELDDNFVDSPSELIGRPMYFIVRIFGCRGLPPRFTDIYVKYKMYLDSEFTQTEVVSKPSNPDFEHEKLFSFVPVTRQLIDYLKDDCLMLYVYGRQINRNSNTGNSSKSSGRATRLALSEEESSEILENLVSINGRKANSHKQNIILDLLQARKELGKMQQRITNIKKLVHVLEERRKYFVSTRLLKDLLSTTSPELADKLIYQNVIGEENGKALGYFGADSSVEPEYLQGAMKDVYQNRSSTCTVS